VPPLVIFDLDGTLTDSADGIVDALGHALRELGLDQPDEATMRSFLGPPLAITFTEHYGLDEQTSERGIAHYRERYALTSITGNAVFPGIPELLSHLTANGVTLATATSKPMPTAKRILDHFELTEHFAFVGGATMTSERILKADVIAHTLENLPPHDTVVMVGDRHHDITGALAHDIEAIGVTWGYGDADELKAAGATHIVDDTEALADALGALGVMPRDNPNAR
jgi:phosphoglycolate phosphatase